MLDTDDYRAQTINKVHVLHTIFPNRHHQGANIAAISRGTKILSDRLASSYSGGSRATSSLIITAACADVGTRGRAVVLRSRNGELI